MSITKPIEITISKLSTTTKVDWQAMPEITKDFVIQYGLKQILNDAHSACVWRQKDGSLPYLAEYGDEEAAREAYAVDVQAAVDQKLDALMAGQISVRKAGVPKDPRLEFMIDFIAEQRGITKKKVREAVKVQGADKFLAAFEASKVAQAEYARRQQALQVEDGLLEGLLKAGDI